MSRLRWWPVCLGLVVVACGVEPGVAGVESSLPSVPVVSVTSPVSVTTSEVSTSPVVDDIYEVAVEPGLSLAEVSVAVTDRSLNLGTRSLTLDHQPLDALGGSLVPWVVPDRTGERVYYTVFEDEEADDALSVGEVGGIPVIRVVDVITGADSLWREGSYAPAVRFDGAVGFAQDVDGAYRYSVPNPTRLVVADGEVDEVWSEGEATLVPVGWAGRRLVAIEVGEGEWPRAWIYDGPGESRLLADGATLGAISPDGSWLLLVVDAGFGRYRLEVVEVATGEVAGALDPAFLPSYGGLWSGETIVLPVVDGYAVLSWDDSLQVDRVVRPALSERFTVQPPLLGLEDGVVWLRVLVEAARGYHYLVLACPLGDDPCTATEPIGGRSIASVGNPSSRTGQQ